VALSVSADQTVAAATLVVSRIQYVAPTPAPDPFPQIFDDSSVSSSQGNIVLDYYKSVPGAPLLSLAADRRCGGTAAADYHDELQLEIRRLIALVAGRPLPDLYGVQCRGWSHRGIEFRTTNPNADHRRH
jgi:hypothetical protein